MLLTVSSSKCTHRICYDLTVLAIIYDVNSIIFLGFSFVMVKEIMEAVKLCVKDKLEV